MLGAREDVDRLWPGRRGRAALDDEGMSNAVMEAMAAGRPIVATAVGGTPELLGDGRGMLVQPGDAEGLADAVAAVLSDPELAQEIGAAARAWAGRTCAATRWSRQHLDLYRRLLGTPVCGIAGTVVPAASDPDPGTADVRHDGPPRARRRRPARRTRSPRSACGGWRSSTSPAAASRCPTRTARSWPSSTARSTTSAELRAGPARAAGTGFTHAAATPSASSTSTRSTATTWCTSCAACSPSPSGTRRQRRLLLARDRVGKKPLYWRDRDRSSALRLRAEGAARATRTARAELDPVALHHYLTYQYVRRRGRSTRASPSCRPVTCWSGRAGSARVGPLLAAGPHPEPPVDRRGGRRRTAARTAAGGGPASGWSASARSARSCPAASTRRPSSRPWPGRSREAGADVLHRLRGRRLRRAPVRRGGGRALRHRPPRAGRARRDAAATSLPEPRLALRRAVRRLLGDPQPLRGAAEPART